uniref:Uncharacterized protein n=1 Tax=Schistosoma japonicum TaxID=6182 RepID=Q5BZ13_SCHJA|nr:unknown [Schistosoma japonicum]
MISVTDVIIAISFHFDPSTNVSPSITDRYVNKYRS